MKEAHDIACERSPDAWPEGGVSVAGRMDDANTVSEIFMGLQWF
jgi:hypothetical protein